MSNINTSYVRIKRRDGEHLTHTEIEKLFQMTVNVGEEFGSYWVRIVKKYRQKEKCLDIQFGSGKSYSDIFDDPENFKTYHISRRYSSEGGKDKIFEYEQIDGLISSTNERLCLYAFDRIEVTADENWLEEMGASHTDSSDRYFLKIDGNYLCANCKSFVDLFEDSPFYGPCLQYDESYAYDYFVLTQTENLEFKSPSFLIDLQKDNYKRMPDNSSISFLFNYRKVLEIRKINGNIEIQSADYWDNCVDDVYLSTCRKFGI